jgi:DNA-directed RNA polymerase subunit RPC12/RpoP
MGVWLTIYRQCGHMTRQVIANTADRRIDASGRCAECRGQLPARSPKGALRQNEPTDRRCPVCGGELLLMTRRRDGHRFYACRNYYAPAIRCRYTADQADQAEQPAEVEP